MEDAAAFANAHPKVRLNISFNDQMHDLLTEGFDLAIRITMSALADSSMRASKLLEIRGVVCASPTYLANYRKPKSPADLLEHQWVVGARSQLDFHSDSGEVESIKVEPRIRIDNSHAALGFVLQHIGLAVLPDRMADEGLRAGTLVEVLPQWQLRVASVYAIWPPHAGRTSLSSRFVDFLRSELPRHLAEREARGVALLENSD